MYCQLSCILNSSLFLHLFSPSSIWFLALQFVQVSLCNRAERRELAGPECSSLCLDWLSSCTSSQLKSMGAVGNCGSVWSRWQKNGPFLLLWHAQQHTNGSTLITGHIISWSQGSGVVGLCNKGNGVSSNIFSSDLEFDH